VSSTSDRWSLLLLTAFWTFDSVTGKVTPQFTLDNFRQIVENPTFRTVALRTIGFAIGVTIADILIAFPIAYYMARVAAPRTRAILFMSCLLPLLGELSRPVYAWRVILAPNGPLDWFLAFFGLGPAGLYPSDLGAGIVLTYVWLPYMILPLYAGLERVPHSLLEGERRPRRAGLHDVPARHVAADPAVARRRARSSRSR
jgi:putative spermidine/putrescine transport system permease protein